MACIIHSSGEDDPPLIFFFTIYKTVSVGPPDLVVGVLILLPMIFDKNWDLNGSTSINVLYS